MPERPVGVALPRRPFSVFFLRVGCGLGEQFLRRDGVWWLRRLRFRQHFRREPRFVLWLRSERLRFRLLGR